MAQNQNIPVQNRKTVGRIMIVGGLLLTAFLQAKSGQMDMRVFWILIVTSMLSSLAGMYLLLSTKTEVEKKRDIWMLVILGIVLLLAGIFIFNFS